MKKLGGWRDRIIDRALNSALNGNPDAQALHMSLYIKRRKRPDTWLWMRLRAEGDSEILELDRNISTRLFSVPIRYLHTLGPVSSQSSAVSGEHDLKNAIKTKVFEALKLKGGEKARRELYNLFMLNNVTVLDCNQMLAACWWWHADAKVAHSIWMFMSEKRIMLNTYSVACLLHLYCRGGQLTEALKLLYMLGKEIDVQPHIDFCCIFLHGCWSAESINHAEMCLHYIKERDLNKNEVVYLELLKLSGVKKDKKASIKAWSQIVECCKPSVPCLQSYYAAIKALRRIEWPLETALLTLQKMAEVIAKNEGFLLCESKMGVYSVFSSKDLKDSEEVVNIMMGKETFETSLQKEAIGSVSRITRDKLSGEDGKEKSFKLIELDPVENSSTSCEVPSMARIKTQEDATICANGKDSGTDGTIFDQIYGWTRLAMQNLEEFAVEELPKNLQSIESPICWSYEHKHARTKTILRQSFNVVCSHCVQKGDLQAAKILFRQLQTVGLKPDVNSYNAILNAVVKESGLLQGFQLVKNMEKDGTQPNINTYNVILKGFCLQLELDKAEALLERMLKTDGDQRPSTLSFNLIFKACVTLDDPLRALRVFAKMVEADIKPNRSTILHLVEVFGRVNFPLRRGTSDSNEELVRRLEAIETYMERSNMPHNCRSFNHVLAALSTEGMVDNVVHRLNVAEGCVGNDGLPIVSTVTFNIALTTCSRAQQWVAAKDIFKRMKVFGFNPDRETYNIFMNCCAEQKKIDDAFGYLNEMREEKIQPDVITYNTLIKVCCRSNNLDAAISLMRDMDELGLAPCIVTFLTLVQHAVIKERLHMVEFFVEHMHRKKVQPTISLCELVVSAYLTCHRVEDAVEALRVLSTRMVPEDIQAAGQSENILKQVYLEDGVHAEESSLEILKNAMVKQGPIPEALLAARLSGLGNADIGEWNAEESWWAKRLRDQYVPL